MLKNKLSILATQLIKTSDLTEIEKEKEDLNTELIDYEARLLKFEEKEKQWEKDAVLWAEKEKDFETKQVEMGKELKEKNVEQQLC